jgi:uncharacterized Zn finger protein
VSGYEVANILHRDTIATIVGARTFDRGQRCLDDGRVLGVESRDGELVGVVRPQEASRPAYEIRIWVRDDGLAYQCTCPMGEARHFCKHAVAVALAHLGRERRQLEGELAVLRADLMNVSMAALLDGLIAHAQIDRALLDALRAICARGRR